MPPGEIEDSPYVEGTLTKLEIFQLYARAWLPVFTAPLQPRWRKIHLFDFFSGRGRDSQETPGSPLRLLSEIGNCWPNIQLKNLQVTLTCCDSDPNKIKSLSEYVAAKSLIPPGLKFDAQCGEFELMFARYQSVLRDPDTACFVLLDQYGFKQVGTAVFQKLVDCPTTDFLFFISTQHLHRFNNHPAVRKYLALEKTEDYYLAHRAVLNFYRDQVPDGLSYYLAPFSFRKGSNIYSVIFGSGHPRGMEQFLSVAWKKDKLNGEADYDLNREDFNELEPFLDIDMFGKPKKTQVFEASLESAIKSGQVISEKDIYLFCLENGMMPGHAAPVLKKLKEQKVIECAFKSPSRDSLKTSRFFRIW
jgi:three-Cys-motif partner protein